MNKSNNFGNLDELFIVTGNELDDYVKEYTKLTPRDLLEDIINYLEDKNNPKLLELYGLRRTGKTVLMMQSIFYLLNKGIPKDNIVYIECNENNSLHQIINILKYRKYKYVFIDEITYLNDFISLAGILCTCSYGIKIVLTGTDSLTFDLAKSKMYDRFIRVSTTFISYKEWYKIKNGNTSISDYLKNGGILGDYKNADSYINESVNNNIKNSLRNIVGSSSDYNCESLLGLIELYPRLVIKVTENFSNNFIKSIILKSLDSSLNEGLRKLYNGFPSRERNLVNKVLTDVLDLDLKKYDINQIDLDILCFYLYRLDLYKKVEVKNIIDNKILISYHNLQVQPIIRFNQYVEFLDILEKELKIFNNDKDKFEDLFIPILEGKLLEQVVVCNIMKVYNKNYTIFSYRENDTSEIDLVIKNEVSRECALIEIKRAFKYKSKYHQWLVNRNTLDSLDINLGINNIKKKIVLYQGENKHLESIGIDYINVEEFLLNIETLII